MTTRGPLAHRDFRRLWLADALSQVGSRMDVLAIPLLATTTLSASVFQVSLLRTLATLPYLVLGLQVGAWCDRMRHRPILIVADLGRAALIGSIPVAAVFGGLTLAHLYVVVTGAGVLGVFFDIAHPTYLPHLVGRDDLPEANSRLQMNLSAGAVAGPGLAGLVIQAAGSAGAMAVDAVSYLWSAAWLSRIETPDTKPERPRQPLRHAIRDGFRALLGNRILLAINAHGAASNFFQSAQTGIVIVFLSRELHLNPVVIGVLSTTQLSGAITAGLTARRIAARLGHGRTLLGIALVYGLAFGLIALTGGGWALGFYVTGGFLASYSVITLNVVCISFQQAVTPPELLGRVTSIGHTLLLGVVPAGSVLGGWLATAAGIRPTLEVAAAGILASALFLFCSPLRRMRDLPVSAGGRR